MFRAGRFRFMRECSLKRSADFVPGACARTRSIPRSETGGAEAPRLQKPREKEKEAALKGRLVKQEGRGSPRRAPRPRHKSTKKSRGTMYRAPTLEGRKMARATSSRSGRYSEPPKRRRTIPVEAQ